MRFLNRQLLRGIIAASLAVAGASTGLASPGKIATQWKDICFISDADSLPSNQWQDDEISGPCLLGLNSVDMKCEDATLAIDTEQALAQLSEPEAITPNFQTRDSFSNRMCSVWIHGLQSSSQWMNHWTQARRELVSRFEIGTASILNHLIASQSSIHHNGLSESELDSAFAGNIFVYSLENVPDEHLDSSPSDQHSASDVEQKQIYISATAQQPQDVCPSEAFASACARPPQLEGDLGAKQVLASKGRETNENLVTGSLESDPQGIGHCQIISEVSDVVADESAPRSSPSTSFELATQQEITLEAPATQFNQSRDWNTAFAELPYHTRFAQVAGLQGRTLLETWIDPQWDLHTWANTPLAFPYESNERTYQAGSWTKMVLDRWIVTDKSIAKSVAIDEAVNDPEFAIDVDYADLLHRDLSESLAAETQPSDLEESTAEPVGNDVVRNEYRTLEEDWALVESIIRDESFSSTLAHINDAAEQHPVSYEAGIDEASRIATKAIALRLKQLGELLIQSAERLNQVSDAIEFASRSATQR